MNEGVAIGIGCRKGCAGSAIAALVRRALALTHTQGQAAILFTAEAKGSESGLLEAASVLGMALVLLPHAELEAASARCATRSERVQKLLGLPSLAEAAALAGAGAGSRLTLERISEGGASCAVAQCAEPAR